jgi:predicted ATPase
VGRGGIMTNNFPSAPITLVYGKNGSGKSRFIFSQLTLSRDDYELMEFGKEDPLIPPTKKKVIEEWLKHLNINVNTEYGFSRGILHLGKMILRSLKGGQVVIQHPEFCLHPNIQVELGSFFVEMIKRKDIPTNFIIETHSEHLVLRLMKLIRKGEITCDDVHVYWIDNEKPHQIPLNDRGEFTGNWPEGFFDERMDELF